MLCNGAGFYVYYVLQLQQIRMEMRGALKQTPDHLLDKFTLSQKDFKEAKVEDHEVMVDGKMYDIARVQMRSDSVFVYCLHDEKEDDLLILVDYLVSCPVTKKDSIPGVVMRFLSLTFLIPSTHFGLPERSLTPVNFAPYTFDIKLFAREIHSPPPRV